ncbi:carboxypeptidase B-like [Mya arenaria]|uniref:carboxypeptidase B-like n=1 Tax=Mya arenaria TaxID=6604 RepID=UPI0022E5E8F0|nr:carboxypeptidase B-like [Mya arenaria]
MFAFKALYFGIFVSLHYGVNVVLSTGPLSQFRVIRITPSDSSDVETLLALTKNANFDVWKWPSAGSPNMDVMLSREERRTFLPVLQTNGLQFHVMIKDVQRLIDVQRSSALKSRSRGVGEFEYFKYHTLDEIFAWMENITSVYKDRASLFNVTTSYEGRPLMGLKISNPSVGPADRPAFWIEGGIHAREWISPATVVFMAGQMLDLYKLDPELTAAVDKFDWYILPVTNPDGYSFTWKDDKSRLWRKTRSPQGKCIGVDPNRNWDLEWCKSGASKDPCSDTYCGPEAFSEPEVKGVSDFLQGLPNLKAFIDVHSYSQLWMSPWGYTKKLPENYKLQDGGSAVATDALEKMYGTKYEHGSIAGILYEASGSSADWVYGKLKVPFSYAVELRDTGKYGFLLPEDQILPTGHETLEAVRALVMYIYENIQYYNDL